MRQEIVEARDLWRADWNGLCRLARFVGIDVGNLQDGPSRGVVVNAVMRRITELRAKDWARRRWHT